MAIMHQQTELRYALEAKLEMAEEALAYSNCAISQLTIQILIQPSKGIGPLDSRAGRKQRKNCEAC